MLIHKSLESANKAYNKSHHSHYSNTLKPKMCNDFSNLIDNKVGNARTLSSHLSNLKLDHQRSQRDNICPYEVNSNNTNTNSNTLKSYNPPRVYPPPAVTKKMGEGKSITYLTSFPQTLNTFTQPPGVGNHPQKINYSTSTAVTPSSSSTDGSEIILVASSTQSPTQSSCSSDADYFQQRNQTMYHAHSHHNHQNHHPQQQHVSNNLIINDKHNQYNQSFYQNDRIIAKFSNIRQYVDMPVSDEQDIDDEHEEKTPCLYVSSSNSTSNSGLNANSTLNKAKNRSNHFLRSSAV